MTNNSGFWQLLQGKGQFPQLLVTAKHYCLLCPNIILIKLLWNRLFIVWNFLLSQYDDISYTFSQGLACLRALINTRLIKKRKKVKKLHWEKQLLRLWDFMNCVLLSEVGKERKLSFSSLHHNSCKFDAVINFEGNVDMVLLRQPSSYRARPI